MTRAFVRVNAEHAGVLERSPRGALFTYDAEYVAAHGKDASRAVSFSLPIQADPHENLGANLHPYFAGLLPEGIRLRALQRATKTSPDDLFGQLLLVGRDCVGAVSITAEGESVEPRAPWIDVSQPDTLDFDEITAENLGLERLDDRAIAGEQQKVSAGILTLPIRGRKSSKPKPEYILKIAPSEYPHLVKNEHWVMRLAQRAGIDVANTQVINDRHGRAGLLVERFDRVGTMKIAQEDICQLRELYPADKYRIDFADVLDALSVCTAPKVERMRALMIKAFSYLVTNGDLHGKNLSVRRNPNTGTVELTPAYDLLATLPYGDDSMAIDLCGRDKKLKRVHFIEQASRFDLPARAVERQIDRIITAISKAVPAVGEIGFDAKKTRHMQRVMTQRIEELRSS